MRSEDRTSQEKGKKGVAVKESLLLPSDQQNRRSGCSRTGRKNADERCCPDTGSFGFFRAGIG